MHVHYAIVHLIEVVMSSEKGEVLGVHFIWSNLNKLLIISIQNKILKLVSETNEEGYSIVKEQTDDAKENFTVNCLLTEADTAIIPSK
jgi:hypothetical protein